MLSNCNFILDQGLLTCWNVAGMSYKIELLTLLIPCQIHALVAQGQTILAEDKAGERDFSQGMFIHFQ